MTTGHRIRAGAGQSGLRQGLHALAVLALAYALVLRALALPVMAAPADGLSALLSDPHALCLSDAGADHDPHDGLPAAPSDHCGDCCLLHARLAPDPAATSFTALSWPRTASPAGLHAPEQPARGPHREAWSPIRTQRGPPVDRIHNA